MLKGGDSIITDWLLKLMKEVWRTGVVPQDWKDAELIPLYKNGDRKRCDNYQGISLLCARESAVPDVGVTEEDNRATVIGSLMWF